jgi:hypothetical protein
MRFIDLTVSPLPSPVRPSSKLNTLNLDPRLHTAIHGALVEALRSIVLSLGRAVPGAQDLVSDRLLPQRSDSSRVINEERSLRLKD